MTTRIPAGRTHRGQTTRRALVSSALTLFEQKGVDLTSIDEITSAADVAKGTFYVHFQRKQDVLLEWATELVDALDAVDTPADVEGAIRQLGRDLAAEVQRGPRVLRGPMVREIVGNSADWVRVLGDRPPLWAKIIPLLEHGQDQGTIRADQSALRLATALTILWLDTVVGWAERDSSRPLPDAIELATDLFLGGAHRG